MRERGERGRERYRETERVCVCVHVVVLPVCCSCSWAFAILRPPLVVLSEGVCVCLAIERLAVGLVPDQL